ncbi:MAG: hypothetical protein GX230_05600 [Lentisphaerae bacterium]|nr:hypothetical protein [Lentisphaerota bacterium]
MNSEQQRLEQYETYKKNAFDTRFDRWSTLLRDIDRTANPEHTVVRFPNASSYLFTTGFTKWAIDPVYSAYKNYTDAEYDIFLKGMEQFPFVIITHCHADHCQKSMLHHLHTNNQTSIIIPAAISDLFFTNNQLAPADVTILNQGETIEIDGIKITCYAGYHSEPGTPGYPSGSFLVTLPDGVTIFFPVDIRDYSLPPPANLPPIDYLFGHVWLGRDCSHHADFPMVADFSNFMLRFKPTNLILTHLCEISRSADSMWLPRHADLIKKEIATLSPETYVTAPHFGSLLTLEKKFTRDIFVDWPQTMQSEFLNNLGVCIKLDRYTELIDDVIASRSPLLELNGALPEDIDTLANKIDSWRSVGGRILSYHIPDIVPASLNLDKLIAGCKTFIELGIDRVTLHPPRCPVADFHANSSHYFELYATLVEPLVKAGLAIGIENMHMAANEPPHARYRLGHLPAECVMFIDKLSAKTGYKNIGFHFDIGHAANNTPYTQLFPPAYWLQTLGHLINGMHLHQFIAFPCTDNPFPEGHRHVCGRTGGYPDFSPLFETWTNHTARAPMFLEVSRGIESSPLPSLHRLRNNW